MKDNMLYIDGELVDIDEKTKITLNYKSNIFSDISKIVSNNSYTIKLPNTVRNQRIFQHAELPTANSSYPRVYHKARYFRNGVEVLSDALAVLISSGDSFDIALTWGNASVFEPLVKNSKKLNELTDSGEYLVWSKDSGYNKFGEGNFLFSEAQYGVDMNADGANVWALPAVRVPFILNLIEKEFGIGISIPYPENSLTDNLLVLCETKKESDVVLYNNPYVLTCDASGDSGNDRRLLLNWIRNESTKRMYKVEYVFPANISSWIVQTNDSDVAKIRISGSVSISNFSIQNANNTNVIIKHVSEDGAETIYKQGGTPVVAAINSVSFSYDVNIKSGNGSKFYFSVQSPVGCNILDPMNFVIKMSPKGTRDIEYNEQFPIIPNLPGIKIVDFLKNMTQLVGLFSSPNVDSKSISFFKVENIYSNIRKAIDVTDRVIAQTRDNRPRGVTYTINGLARNNRFDYKKDESVKSDYSGVVTVSDKTIDFEKDAVKMEFAASDTQANELAIVPLYSYDKDGKIEENSIETKIFREFPYNQKSALGFEQMGWKDLIQNYYSAYQKIVSSPVIINEKIELTDIEIKTLDMTVPFYLGQYGRYYAIISIKAEDTGLCECELLQMEV